MGMSGFMNITVAELHELMDKPDVQLVDVRTDAEIARGHIKGAIRMPLHLLPLRLNELGSGKTAFAKALGKMMGINEHIVSPTFVIMKSYNIDWKGFKKLIHVDAYRIESESELLNLGWNELVENPQHLILIEWPERVEGILPKDSRRIFFKHEI